MAEVTIYTIPFCPFCIRAKSLLKRKGIAFREINVMGDPDLRAEMARMAGGVRTVPQVFVDGRHIGDCEQIHRLDSQGKLDPLLATG